MDLWLAGTFPLLLWLLPNNIECLGCIYIAYFGAILLGIIVRYPNAKTLLSSLFSFWYIPFNLHFFILLARQLEGNIALGVLLWIVCVTKFTDIGGFIIGCAFGKRKLAPQVSPKKTWEGVLGGVIFASCLGVSLTSLFPAFFPLNLLKSVLFACLLAGGAIVSDLVESVLKRQSQQKDSGSFIPGIGGALDLIDSLLLNAPVSYLLFQYF